MAGKKFNSRRAPAGQLKVRVGDTCKSVIRRNARGNIKRVTLQMARNAAGKAGLPAAEVIGKLRQMGAPI